MNAVFIALPTERAKLDTVGHRLAEAGNTVDNIVESPIGPRLFVEKGDNHVFVFSEDHPSEMPADLSQLLRDGKRVLVIEDSHLPLLKSIIELLANDDSATVENDVDGMLSGMRFVERIRNEPDWDWRTRR